MNNTLTEDIFRLRDEGLSYKKIGKMLGISKTTAWRLGSEAIDTPALESDPLFPVPGLKCSPKQLVNKEKEVESILEFLERMTPVCIGKQGVHTSPKESPSNTTMVIGDTHFGCEDQQVLDVFLAAVAQIQPKRVILNGDTLDMSYISRYPKDYRSVVSLDEERRRFHTFLRDLCSVTERCQTDIIETNANHSGNDNNGRWWRYLNDRVGELLSMPLVQEKLSYTSIFHPMVNSGEISRLSLVDMFEVIPDTLVVLHGDVVRKRGGFSAAALLEKWHMSLICNHTHRVGMSSRTIPALGRRQPETLTSYENGCACSLSPSYATAADWQHSFSVVHHGADAFNVEQIVVRDGVACIGSLGKTLTA